MPVQIFDENNISDFVDNNGASGFVDQDGDFFATSDSSSLSVSEILSSGSTVSVVGLWLRTFLDTLAASDIVGAVKTSTNPTGSIFEALSASSVVNAVRKKGHNPHGRNIEASLREIAGGDTTKMLIPPPPGVDEKLAIDEKLAREKNRWK